MERVRFHTKNSLGSLIAFNILITEFDRGHLGTRGRRCKIELMRMECVEADGSISVEHDFGPRVAGIDGDIHNFEFQGVIYKLE